MTLYIWFWYLPMYITCAKILLHVRCIIIAKAWLSIDNDHFCWRETVLKLEKVYKYFVQGCRVYSAEYFFCTGKIKHITSQHRMRLYGFKECPMVILWQFCWPVIIQMYVLIHSLWIIYFIKRQYRDPGSEISKLRYKPWQITNTCFAHTTNKIQILWCHHLEIVAGASWTVFLALSLILHYVTIMFVNIFLLSLQQTKIIWW